ncbi:MAG: tRNA-(ms[2]io[6]A)-hydroxylase [Polyangiaceae bacterium]|nr:tRNA-(ms[2]io[6]A)-hydroxylase [Polyangiaceae bacterium]
MLDLRIPTSAAWLETVLANFDSFLVDHAACERKASATGMSFVVRYPDRKELLDDMIEFAREELEHFHRVYRVMAQRGLMLDKDYRDEYVRALRQQARQGGTDGLIDSLLVAGVVEARGCERLKMVADALPAAHELKEMYMDLARAESRHHAFFFRLARFYAPFSEVRARADELLDYEATVVERLPIEARVH